MASVHRRKLASGTVTYQVAWRDLNGKQRHKNFPNRADAKVFAADKEREHRNFVADLRGAAKILAKEAA